MKFFEVRLNTLTNGCNISNVSQLPLPWEEEILFLDSKQYFISKPVDRANATKIPIDTDMYVMVWLGPE